MYVYLYLRIIIVNLVADVMLAMILFFGDKKIIKSNGFRTKKGDSHEN